MFLMKNVKSSYKVMLTVQFTLVLEEFFSRVIWEDISFLYNFLFSYILPNWGILAYITTVAVGNWFSVVF